MDKVPGLIYEICPSCNPRSYNKTLAKFMGETEGNGPDLEYLYQCTDCGAKMWVSEQWAKRNEVKEALTKAEAYAKLDEINVEVAEQELESQKSWAENAGAKMTYQFFQEDLETIALVIFYDGKQVELYRFLIETDEEPEELSAEKVYPGNIKTHLFTFDIADFEEVYAVIDEENKRLHISPLFYSFNMTLNLSEDLHEELERRTQWLERRFASTVQKVVREIIEELQL